MYEIKDGFHTSPKVHSVAAAQRFLEDQAKRCFELAPWRRSVRLTRAVWWQDGERSQV